MRPRLSSARLALVPFLAISVSAVAFADGPAAAPAAASLPEAESAAAFAALDAQVKEHLKDKNNDALKADIKEIAKAYPAAFPKHQEKYGGLFALISKQVKEDDVQRAIIKAVGETKNDAIFYVIRPFLQQPDKKAVPTLMKDAIEATAKMVPESAVPLLMSIVTDSKEFNISAVAMKALGSYGDNKRVRQGILRDCIATVSKDQPSRGFRWKKDGAGNIYETANLRSGNESQLRWGALSPALVESMNKLTGQNCGSADDWITLFTKYKSNTGELFTR
jgi:hypothetical protein